MKTLYRITLVAQKTHWLYLDLPVDTELSQEQIKALVSGSNELDPEWAVGFKVNHLASVEKENRSMPWLDEEVNQEVELGRKSNE